MYKKEFWISSFFDDNVSADSKTYVNSNKINLYKKKIQTFLYVEAMQFY